MLSDIINVVISLPSQHVIYGMISTVLCIAAAWVYSNSSDKVKQVILQTIGYLVVFNEIVYVDCDTGNDEDAVREVLDQLGERKIAMIRNHGVFVLGKSVAEVLFLTITLEYACRCQLDAMRTHAKVKTFNLDSVEQLAAGFTGNPENEFVFDGTLQWEGWLRKLDRMGSCYRE